jgi:hypothetical protein
MNGGNVQSLLSEFERHDRPTRRNPDQTGAALDVAKLAKRHRRVARLDIGQECALRLREPSPELRVSDELVELLELSVALEGVYAGATLEIHFAAIRFVALRSENYSPCRTLPVSLWPGTGVPGLGGNVWQRRDRSLTRDAASAVSGFLGAPLQSFTWLQQG